jgi:hypothetical protein
VQALDLMRAPPAPAVKTASPSSRGSSRTRCRPLGYAALALPCQLMGTGMAFPWRLIQAAPLASGHIVEDLRLGFDLAAAGAPPLFCPQALVTSVFPSHSQGMRRPARALGAGPCRRHRPGGAARAVARVDARLRPALAAMALDVCVPPLTMLVLVLVAQVVLDASSWAAGGAGAPLALALVALALVTARDRLAWLGFARRIVSLGELLAAPLYVVAKLPLYARFFGRGKREWVRARQGRAP